MFLSRSCHVRYHAASLFKNKEKKKGRETVEEAIMIHDEC